MNKRIKILLSFALVAIVALTAVTANADLVAYWPLTDGEDGTTVTGADDIIDDADHGATDATANASGDTWVFDATRDSIVLSTTEGNRLTAGTQDIDLEDGFTWSLWAKVASSNLTDPGADSIIGTRAGSWHKIGTGGVNSASWSLSIGGYQLADDTWHHIAYVGDLTDGVSLYIDGLLIGTDTSVNSTTIDPKLEIGGTSQYSEDITGLMSDVAIWDERLSENQIAALAAGAGVISPVNAGDDMITWSGQGVQLNPVYTDGFTPNSFVWSANDDTGVVFSDPDDSGNENASEIEAPFVTITKGTDNPSMIKLTLIASDGNMTFEDKIGLDVYDNACKAGIAAGLVTFDKSDLDGNCITNLADLAILAQEWMADYAITAAQVKPVQ